MYSFPRSVLAEEPSSNDPVIMFADDVELRARYRDGLQALLGQAETWAVANDMTWKVVKRSIICAEPNQGNPIKLAGEVEREVTRAEYLGVTMMVEGITHHHCLNRISKAKKSLTNSGQSDSTTQGSTHQLIPERTLRLCAPSQSIKSTLLCG